LAGEGVEGDLGEGGGSGAGVFFVFVVGMGIGEGSGVVVGEGDVFEADVAGEGGGEDGAGIGVFLFGGIEEIEDAFGGGAAGVVDLVEVMEAGDGFVEEA
jgi:hypothetical protein